MLAGVTYFLAALRPLRWRQTAQLAILAATQCPFRPGLLLRIQVKLAPGLAGHVHLRRPRRLMTRRAQLLWLHIAIDHRGTVAIGHGGALIALNN